MLGVPPEEARTQTSDALGEICNIVAGYFKANIGLGEQCVLSVPTVVVGKHYRVCSSREGSKIDLPLLFENQPLSIALQIRS